MDSPAAQARAILSIGTNSTRVLVARLVGNRPEILFANSIGTRIGEGLRESGELGEEQVRRTLDALQEHLLAVVSFAATPSAIATSALRRAQNADNFADRVEALVGVPLRILSGIEEARAAYRGAVSILASIPAGGVGVLDCGGGSTEYAVGAQSIPTSSVSCEIGAVRLTEMLPVLGGRAARPTPQDMQRAREIARVALTPVLALAPVARLIFVGGSATTCAAVRAETLEPPWVCELSSADLGDVIECLRKLPLERRRELPGMRPQRADILLAGALLLDESLAMLGHDAVLVSAADLPLGYFLLESQESARRDAQEGPEPVGS